MHAASKRPLAAVTVRSPRSCRPIGPTVDGPISGLDAFDGPLSPCRNGRRWLHFATFPSRSRSGEPLGSGSAGHAQCFERAQARSAEPFVELLRNEDSVPGDLWEPRRRGVMGRQAGVNDMAIEIRRVRSAHARAAALVDAQHAGGSVDQYAIWVLACGRIIDHWATISADNVRAGKMRLEDWRAWGAQLERDAEASLRILRARTHAGSGHEGERVTSAVDRATLTQHAPSERRVRRVAFGGLRRWDHGRRASR